MCPSDGSNWLLNGLYTNLILPRSPDRQCSAISSCITASSGSWCKQRSMMHAGSGLLRKEIQSLIGWLPQIINIIRQTGPPAILARVPLTHCVLPRRFETTSYRLVSEMRVAEHRCNPGPLVPHILFSFSILERSLYHVARRSFNLTVSVNTRLGGHKVPCTSSQKSLVRISTSKQIEQTTPAMYHNYHIMSIILRCRSIR